MMTTDGTERGKRERERDRSRIVESEGLQWASHGTRLATSCSEIYTSDYHQPILTVGPLRTSCQCPDCRVCLISKLSFVGVSSQGITFCIGNWISHDHHLSVTGEESTPHAGTVDGKNWTVLCLMVSTVASRVRISECVTLCFVVKSGMLRSKDLQQFNNLLQ